MSAVQTARTTGFRASLSQRGVTLLAPWGAEVEALLEIEPPQVSQYTLANETRNTSIIHVLREDTAGHDFHVGDLFTDQTNAKAYRITRIEDQPVNVAVRFHCELGESD